MKRKLKFGISIIILISSILLSIGGKSQAVLQSNPNTNYKTSKTLVYATPGNAEGWLTAIRKIETNGSMGIVGGSITESTLGGPTDNNIDVHCMKNTEYGAMAILSASAYGYSGKVTTGTTTTGNKTGIDVNTSQWEWTTGIDSKSCLHNSQSAKECYVDVYPRVALTAETAKKGDALVDCAGWHGGSVAWLSGDQRISPRYGQCFLL